MKKFTSVLLVLSFVVSLPFVVRAQEGSEESTAADASYSEEVTAEELGETETEINTATEEEAQAVEETGTLIEIGNTTADETTVVVRTTEEDGTVEDVTLEIETEEDDIENNDGQESDLDEWIAGDSITYEAEENTNSGSTQAIRVRNHAIRGTDVGRNGWITAIRTDENEVDVVWGKDTYTLNLDGAKLVAGVKNPATISDLKVGDRVRARVYEDSDGNKLTWNTKILVVLRRGNVLFMRVTRWVARGQITYLPENPTIPTTITIEILPSKFYEKSDVNNLIGAPGEKIDVYIDETTHMRRKYMGRSLLKEFSEGDTVQVIGRINEDTGVLHAKYIRNTDIQVLGVARHIGVVTMVSASSSTITATDSATAKEWTIKVSSATELQKQGEDIALTDIVAGDKIRVIGSANKRLMTINAKKVIVLGDRPMVVNKRVMELKEKRKQTKAQ